MGNKAVIYCRLSKEDDDIKDGMNSESIQNQEKMLREAVSKREYELIDTYIDDDYSGLSDERPEFQRMIRDAEKNKFDIILVKSQDRFTRNVEHAEKYIHRLLYQLGIRVIGLVDGTDSFNPENKKVSQILGLNNEWYSEGISKSINAVFKQKMKEGKFIGSFAPFGYIKDPKDKNRFLIDEDAAEIVRQIYDWYLQGYGCNQICSLLQDKGCPTPANYKKQQGLAYKFKQPYNYSDYGIWSTTSVGRILRDEVYLGNMVQHKTKKVSYMSIPLHQSQ